MELVVEGLFKARRKGRVSSRPACVRVRVRALGESKTRVQPSVADVNVRGGDEVDECVADLVRAGVGVGVGVRIWVRVRVRVRIRVKIGVRIARCKASRRGGTPCLTLPPTPTRCKSPRRDGRLRSRAPRLKCVMPSLGRSVRAAS